METRTLAIIIPIFFVIQHVAVTSGIREKNVTIPGDYTIGAMFPITTAEKCGEEIIDQNGIQNLEALIYSLNKVNEEILKDVDIKLGTIAYDTCYSESRALERALDLVQGNTFDENCKDRSRTSTIHSEKIIGVVGAATSAVSIQLASFLRLFKIPQISYSATSPELSDTKRYDYFRRTVSSDEFQAKAIIQVLKSLNITYVFGIYEDTSYGQEGILKIRTEALAADICIGESYRAKRFYTSEAEKDRELKSIVQSLLNTNSTTGEIVVIMFASQEVVEGIFYEVSLLSRDQQRRFHWVGSDAWTGRQIKNSLVGVATNSIGVQPEIKIIPDFDKYFTSLNPFKNSSKNPWFRMYWEQKFNCTLEYTLPGSKIKSSPHACKDTFRISDAQGTYTRNFNTYAVMDAVYAFAYALRSIHKDKCIDAGICMAMQAMTSQDVQNYLQNVSFIDPAKREFQFYGNGGPARYSVMKKFNESGKLQWQEIALFNDSKIIWNGPSSVATTRTVFQPSQCSPPCRKGQIQSRNQCCWTCKDCAFYEIVVNDETCLPCEPGFFPDKEQRECIAIEEMTMDFSNLWAIILIILSCIGIIITIIVAVIFYKHRLTPIIMASGKELSFVLLVGICMSYISTFVFVAYPTPIQCGATRLMLGICYTLGYAAILVKTNRIYRVFNIQIRKPKKVKFIGAKSQLLITFAIVMVEVAALTTWLIFQPPEVTFDHPTRRDNIRLCKDSTGFAYLGSLAYPFFLMILCVVYAVKTRKTPDGFNETRYITFGSYSFCIMWIAFVSIYFSVTNNTIRIVSLCLAMTVNATVTLVTLFITKAYLVVLRPQKNTKENVMSRRRTRTYETIDFNNMNHLSRMASAVSTWHSTTNLADTGGPFQMKKPVLPTTFGSNMSIAVISERQLNQSSGNIPALPSNQNRPLSSGQRDSELLSVIPLERLSKSDDAINIQSKDETDMIRNEIVSKMLDIPNGIDPKLHTRRSLRSMRSRRRRTRRERRPRSLELDNPPNIMVTPSSNEHLDRGSTVTTFKVPNVQKDW